jgi:hypothetical protein
MAYGLQLWSGAGVKWFDSTQAVGGVCVGFYTVPTGGGSVSFPDMAGTTGIILHAMTGGPLNSAVANVDYTLGYPRFNFGAVCSGYTFCLFVK